MSYVKLKIKKTDGGLKPQDWKGNTFDNKIRYLKRYFAVF